MDEFFKRLAKAPTMCTLDAQHNVHPCEVEEYITWVLKTFEGQSTPEKEANCVKASCVGHDEIGSYRISTRCLHVNLSAHVPGGLWFETMIFENEKPIGGDRYATWAEAEEGHAAAVRRCKGSVEIPIPITP